jgi:hypothetical protein
VLNQFAADMLLFSLIHVIVLLADVRERSFVFELTQHLFQGVHARVACPWLAFHVK